MKKYVGNNNNWMQYNRPKLKASDIKATVARVIKTVDDREATVVRAVKAICDTDSLEDFQEALRNDKEARDFLLQAFNKEKRNEL